jgi:hypothetical protein
MKYAFIAGNGREAMALTADKRTPIAPPTKPIGNPQQTRGTQEQAGDVRMHYALHMPSFQ